MADIAMLVAEEYERMIKNSRRLEEDEEKLSFVSGVSIIAKAFQVPAWVKDKIPAHRIEALNWVLKPRSQISLAASNGFFSA